MKTKTWLSKKWVEVDWVNFEREKKKKKEKHSSTRNSKMAVSPCGLWVTRGGGVTLAKIVRGCACRTSKIWLSLYQFFAQLPTHQYTIFDKKAPNFAQIGCFFTIICSKYTQFLNLGSFISDENPPIAIPNFAKKHPKRQAHISIPCQCENPPGWVIDQNVLNFGWFGVQFLLNY